MPKNLIRVREYLDVLLGIFVAFQQLNGQKAGRVAEAYVGRLLQVLLYFLDAVLYLMPMIDVNVTITGRLVFSAFIHLNDRMEEFFHTSSIGKDGGNHRNAQQAR